MIEELFFFSDVKWRIFRKILGGVKTTVFVSKKKSRLSCLKEQDWKNKRKRNNKKKESFFFKKKKRFHKKNTSRRNMRESQ